MVAYGRYGSVWPLFPPLTRVQSGGPNKFATMGGSNPTTPNSLACACVEVLYLPLEGQAETPSPKRMLCAKMSAITKPRFCENWAFFASQPSNFGLPSRGHMPNTLLHKLGPMGLLGYPPPCGCRFLQSKSAPCIGMDESPHRAPIKRSNLSMPPGGIHVGGIRTANMSRHAWGRPPCMRMVGG